MNPLKKAYYHLTAYIPRHLPRTAAEYEKLKTVLKEAYGAPDEPATWATVSGQIKSTPANRIRRSWGEIANAAKRLKVNERAQEHNRAAMTEFADKLQTVFNAESERLKQEEEAKKSDEKAKEVQPVIDVVSEPQAQECAPSEDPLSCAPPSVGICH